MNRNTTRAEARRAEKGRRKTRSQADNTPSADDTPSKASAICPVRLDALTNEDVLRSTWTGCLSSVRAQLEEARFGVESAYRLEAACILLHLMARVFRTTSVGFPCCEAASQPHASMAQCAEDLHQLGMETMAVLDAADGNQGVGEAFSRLTSVLQRLPRPERIAEIAVDVRVPWCPCEDCLRSYLHGPRVLSCRHCCTIMAMEGKQP